MNNSKGFTLVEVLLALVIISLAMMAGLSSTQSTTRNLLYVQDRTIAYWVAQNASVAMQLKIDGLRPAAGRWQGQTQMADREWYWRAFSNNTANPHIQQILIEVSEKENGKPITTLIKYWPVQ